MGLPASLQQTIDRMVKNFPWYLPKSGFKQESEAVDTVLERLPFVTASMLEENYYTENNPLASRDDLHCYRTSGTSSGRRKAIFYSKSDEEEYLRIKLDVFRTILGTHGFRTALADMGTGHAEATAVEVFNLLGMKVESISFQSPIEQHIERLESFRPEVLYTMPSILDRILHASDDPAAYGIRHVILVGEIASPVWLRQVAKRLGISREQITDTLGSIEIGTIAYFSHEHGRYLLSEGLIAEGVSAEEIGDGLEPLTEEKERVLVLTSTLREAFPALRYVTYDVVRDLRPIMVDGCLRQSFQGIVKRIGPDLKHGEKISIYDIENVVFQHLGEASVRVKVAGNTLIVYIYSPAATTEVMERIQSSLENRIPEIGMMIQAGILESIRVLKGTFEDSLYSSAVKNKKIFYE
jgi:cysteine synthase A/phenylacetate-CoA ligase